MCARTPVFPYLVGFGDVVKPHGDCGEGSRLVAGDQFPTKSKNIEIKGGWVSGYDRNQGVKIRARRVYLFLFLFPPTGVVPLGDFCLVLGVLLTIFFKIYVIFFPLGLIVGGYGVSGSGRKWNHGS